MTGNLEGHLAEQIDYYRARAPEYEDWWYRRGRYDHGADANQRWFAEAAEVEADLERLGPHGTVLELACGTGIWTHRLAGRATRVTAIDASPEALELAKARVGFTNINYVEADVFMWEPDRTYDVCFFSFWLSHVPLERFRSFWEKVGRALAPTGTVYLVDSARSCRASARDHVLQQDDAQTMLRRLSDGREYQIIKHWFRPDELQRQIAGLGWDAQIHGTAEFFVYGQAKPKARGQ